jgi:hypothetical protein
VKILRFYIALSLAIALTLNDLSPAMAAPMVQPDVTSSLVDGIYKAGQVVPVQVVFPYIVTVTGTPLLTLSTGSPATTNVGYSSGSGTNILTFNYTVATGNHSADLDYANNKSLVLNNGTIRDASGKSVSFQLASPGTPDSLGANKNIIIDAIAPSFSAAAPVPNAFINSLTTSSDVSYTLSEVIANGRIVITKTGGVPPDTGSPHICILIGKALSSGVHNNLDLSNTTDGCKVAQSLVSGAVYSFTFEGTDSAGNATAPVTNSNVTFDATAPSTNIGVPNVSTTQSGPVKYTIGYSDANFNASTLRATDITLNKTGDATGTIGVDTGTGATRTVTISNITGSGTLGISIAPGTASDLAGNLALPAGPSTPFNVGLVTSVFLSIAPVNNAFINSITASSDVSYALDVSIASGSIIMTRTGGSPDTGSPHICSLAGTALVKGVHDKLDLSDTANGCALAQSLVNGSVYTFTFTGTDATGIPVASEIVTGVTFDTSLPVLSGIAPASGAYIDSITTSSAVSYTLNEPIGSGSITMTRTGGSPDAGSPHTCTLTGAALSSGAHNNLNLSDITNACKTAQSLISGAIYTFDFNAVDWAGNAAATVTTSNVTFETSGPVFSSVAPATDAFINSITSSSDVSYALSKPIASGSITMTWTGGTPDADSPHICYLKGTALGGGAHDNLDLSNTSNSCTVPQFLVNGAVYTFTFKGIDSTGALTPEVTKTGITFDTSAPIFSSIAPASNTFIKSTTTSSDVGYTLSEVAASGSITITRMGGSADTGSPHICTLVGTALSDGAHSNLDLSDTTNSCTTAQSLVSGTVYSFSFKATDLAGNLSATLTRTNITFENTTPVFSAVVPATGDYIKSITTTTSTVSYTLSEPIAAGSLTITWTGGTDDPYSPHICTLIGSALNGGVHANFDLSNTTNACMVAESLVDGAVYTFTFDGIDAAGNAAPTVTIADVTFDTTSPTLTWIAPAPCDTFPCIYNVSNQSIQLSVAASDAGRISTVIFKRYDYVKGYRVEIGRVSSPPYSIDFDPSELLPKNNQIDAIAVDAANNSSWNYIFLHQLPILTVNKTGNGIGTVTSSPAAIDCGATCSYGFNDNSLVILTAVPTFPSTFVGWSGVCSDVDPDCGCTGTGTCTLKMDMARSVTATFTSYWLINLPLVLR